MSITEQTKAQAAYWSIVNAQAIGGWCWGVVELRDRQDRTLWRRQTPTFQKGSNLRRKAANSAETDYLNASEGFGLTQLPVKRQEI
jgi:hypothetical protein